MSVTLNCKEWANDTFKNCDFNDQRLTKRLQKIGTQLSSNIGDSLAATCDGNLADLEGGYRFIRNKRVKAEQIEKGAYKDTITKAQNKKLLLAIEDTTTLNFSYDSIKEQLGNIGTSKENTSRGFIVHSTLLIDGTTEETIGLINQKRWCRDVSTVGKKHKRDQIPYKEKESYKWEENSQVTNSRLTNLMSKTISICDREADVYEYINYKIASNQRFIVRACYNRRIEQENKFLFEEALHAPVLGTYAINIQQKQGRKSRIAKIELRSAQVNLLTPKGLSDDLPNSLNVTIVTAKEINPPKDVEPLCWFLLTNEKADNFEFARKISRYYELRWRIEDFHKAWKSGVGVEKQRMQDINNLEKMVVILAFIAVRLLQLKEAFEKENINKEAAISCSTLLSKEERYVLWSAVEKNKPFSKKFLSLGWAYQAIAKLGGWSNSKRTGKASWAAVWEGWFRLQERASGYKVAVKMRKI